MPEIILEIKNLNKQYKKTENLFKLNNISFSIAKGEIVSVIGLNGAGKTTLINLILSIIQPDSGQIIFNNKLFNSDISKIGYLPENFSLNNLSLTVNDFMVLMAALNGYKSNEQKHIASEFINLVGLQAFKGKKTKALSKGMIKRLGIAQSLLGYPHLVILDEPTDGLDPEWRFKIKEILAEKKKMGTSFLISSHLLFELEQMSDKILIIHKGSQLYFGKPDFNSILKYFGDLKEDKLIESLNSGSRQLTLEEIFLTIIHNAN